VRVHYPELEFCTDNGAMIALAAGMRLQAGLVTLDKPQRGYTFDVKPRWNLAELQAEPAVTG
jgi:N6-L-threonylcarbamoyladenine synthase